MGDEKILLKTILGCDAINEGDKLICEVVDQVQKKGEVPQTFCWDKLHCKAKPIAFCPKKRAEEDPKPDWWDGLVDGQQVETLVDLKADKEQEWSPGSIVAVVLGGEDESCTYQATRTSPHFIFNEQGGAWPKLSFEVIPITRNYILYGPPGTGKTYHLSDLVAQLDNGTFQGDFNLEKENREKNRDQYNQLLDAGRVQFVTFHQSYSYEEFVGGIRPKLINDSSEKRSDDNLEYEYQKGVFQEFCEKAAENKGKNYFFIIDEINRGNISKIFGELITLIEESKREGAPDSVKAVLPYTNAPFSVPSNVYILGTMNTADRSIALLDTALRRRFRFIEMMPDYSALKGLPVEGIYVETMLKKMNERIEILYDREHTIGQAYLVGVKTLEELDDAFRYKILPLLQEYFFDDYEKIALVLNQIGDEGSNNRFVIRKSTEGNEGLFTLIDEVIGTALDFAPDYIYELNSGIWDEGNEGNRKKAYREIYKPERKPPAGDQS